MGYSDLPTAADYAFANAQRARESASANELRLSQLEERVVELERQCAVFWEIVEIDG